GRRPAPLGRPHRGLPRRRRPLARRVLRRDDGRVALRLRRGAAAGGVGARALRVLGPRPPPRAAAARPDGRGALGAAPLAGLPLAPARDRPGRAPPEQPGRPVAPAPAGGGPGGGGALPGDAAVAARAGAAP